MKNEILNDFFFKKEQRFIFSFKELKNDRFLIVFDIFLKRKAVLQRLIRNNSSKKGIFKYRLLDLRYIEKSACDSYDFSVDELVPKYELFFERKKDLKCLLNKVLK